MVKLHLPLQFYDESGRVKPPRFYWYAALFLAKSYFVFILSLSNFRDADGLLEVFYPQQHELYFGFAIGLGAVFSMAITAYREKPWISQRPYLIKLIVPLLFVSSALDITHQVQLASQSRWVFSWSIALFIFADMLIIYWLIKSRHVKLMIQDWLRGSD